MSQYEIVVLNSEFEDLRYEEHVMQELGNFRLKKIEAYTPQQTINFIKDADAIINQYGILNKEVIDALNNCKVISSYGVGIDRIDTKTATEKGICVANVPDYCVDEVSDHALTLILNFSRKINFLNNTIKNLASWDFKKAIPIHRFSELTVGILGFGKIPRKLVKKLIFLGYKVKVYDPHVDKDEISQYNAEACELEDIFKVSDFISIHVPLTNETRGMVNKHLFKKAKDNLIIINTSRGPIVNEADLIEALQKGMIAGAGLDVLESEPIDPSNPLLDMDNVILTPHSAWYSEESQKELRVKCARNVVHVLKGYLPKYLVNIDVMDKVSLHEDYIELV